MGVINDKLKPIYNYLITIDWNIEKEWLELTVGLPKEWEYKENKSINFEIINETDVGRVIKLIPKNNVVIIDDLVEYVEIVIRVNNEIEIKKQEFTKEMEEMKKTFQQKISDFYDTLDQEKKKSFDLITTDKKPIKNITKTSSGNRKKITDDNGTTEKTG
jgi:D-ribose pyranose/furanose isomerase RbsD